MARRTAMACVVVLGVLELCGCGYRLSGTGPGTLPAHVRYFLILPFENQTNRPEIEQRLTEEVATLVSRRGQYRVVSDPADADAVLSGAVTSYSTTAVQFNSEGRATRLEALVQVRASLRESKTDEVLWSQAGLLFREQYSVTETQTTLDIEALAREIEALDDIARGAASALVNSIFEGF